MKRRKLEIIRDTLIVLGHNGDNLFRRIKDEIGRGNYKKARGLLWFVDEIIETRVDRAEGVK